VNPTVVGSQVFVGSCSGVLFAFDRATGFVNWDYDTGVDGYQGSFHGQPLLSDGTIVIGTDSPDTGYIYALNIETGELRWKVEIPEGAAANMLRIGDSVITVTLSDKALCLDFATGKERWSVDSGSSQTAGDRVFGDFNWTASPATDGDKIIWGRHDGLVMALEPEKGRVLWQTDLEATVTAHPMLVGSDLYVGTLDHRLYRLKAETGERIASLELEAAPMWEFTPIDGGLMVLLMGAESFVAVDLALSKTLWRLDAEETWSSFRPARLNDAVLVGADDGDLIAAHVKTGEILWKRRLGGNLRGIGVHEEELYVGNLEGTVFALGVPSLTDAGSRKQDSPTAKPAPRDPAPPEVD